MYQYQLYHSTSTTPPLYWVRTLSGVVCTKTKRTTSVGCWSRKQRERETDYVILVSPIINKLEKSQYQIYSKLTVQNVLKYWQYPFHLFIITENNSEKTLWNTIKKQLNVKTVFKLKYQSMPRISRNIFSPSRLQQMLILCLQINLRIDRNNEEKHLK